METDYLATHGAIKLETTASVLKAFCKAVNAQKAQQNSLFYDLREERYIAFNIGLVHKTL